MSDENLTTEDSNDKQSFVALSFEYDNETRILNAHITDAPSEQDISFETIRKEITQEKYKGITVPNPVIQQLLQKIDAKAVGIIELAKKPAFTQLEFTFNEETNELYASLSLAEEDPKIKQMDINRMIEENGYKEYKFEDHAIKNLADKISKNEWGEYLIAKRLDATVNIVIAKDKMQATISVAKAHGGEPLNQAKLVTSITELGISPKLCDEPLLRKILEDQFAENIVFANGIPPIKGEDTKFEPLVKSTVESGPRIDDKGRAHLRDIKEFTIVNENTPVMRRIPFTQGKDGINVLGEVIKATPGKHASFLNDNCGTKRSEDDENLLLAAVKGSPIVLPTGVKIDEVVKFQDIDLSTGNVRVDASIQIDGSVQQGMVVVASGRIIINGSVRNATVMSGEDIHVGEGIVGSKIDEEGGELQATAHVIAKRNIYANYVTLAKLTAEKDIIIGEYVATSDLEAKGKIIVGGSGGKGKIIGGRTNAERGMELNIAGAKSGVTTKLTAGLPLTVKAKLKATLKEKQHILDCIQQAEYLLEQMQEQLEEAGISSECDKIKQSTLSLKKYQIDLNRIEHELQEIESDLSVMRNAGIKVNSHIYENVILNINGVKAQLKEEKSGIYTFNRAGKKIRITKPE